MASYNYYRPGASLSGCPGTAMQGGWYAQGSSTPLATSYINPSTGKPYTPAELGGMSGGGSSGGSSTPSNGYTPGPGQPGWHATPEEQALAQQAYISGGWGAGAGGSTTPTTTPTPGAPGINIPQIPQLAPYKPSPEIAALSGQIGGAISGIIEQGGIGIGEEIKDKLFLRESEMINASTASAIANMEDEMARRGMSNSGQVFSETMKLNSKSTIAMANVMRDVEIQDAYMKLASYENAIGMGVQFLSYLSDESWRQYQPTLMQWQAQVDMYKMAINQAYTVGNMGLAHQYSMEMAQFEADTQLQLTQMQIDAASDAADKKTFWDILGTGLGLLAAIFI